MNISSQLTCYVLAFLFSICTTSLYDVFSCSAKRSLERKAY